MALAFAIVLLAGDAALAVCTPTSPVDNATVTCTGATIDQNLAAGYGTSTDTGNVITVAAGASVTGTGSRDGLIFDTATVLNYGTIAGGLYGIRIGANFADITNAGTISGNVAAIQFFGNGNTLTLTPGSVINGLVQSTAGGNIFQLGGSGAGTFDISALGDTAQYRNFGTFNKIGSSVWTLSGATTYSGDVNVNGGTLLVNGSLASANTIFVSPGATLGGTGTLPATFLDDGATMAPGTPATIWQRQHPDADAGLGDQRAGAIDRRRQHFPAWRQRSRHVRHFRAGRHRAVPQFRLRVLARNGPGPYARRRVRVGM